MSEYLTIEEFSSTNRDKIIGNSLYRICRAHDDYGNWYIHEQFNDGHDCTSCNGYSNKSLKLVIDKFNNLTEEKEIIKECSNEN